MTASEDVLVLARTLRTERLRLWRHLFSHPRAPEPLIEWSRSEGVDAATEEQIWKLDTGFAERGVLRRLRAGNVYRGARRGRPWSAYLRGVWQCEDAVRCVRERMICKNIPLARHMANQRKASEDASQGAFEGLIIAVDRFRPEMGNLFSTYARYWIFHGITQGVMEGALVRIRPKMRKKQRKILSAMTSLEAPSAEELATATGLPIESVESFLQGPRHWCEEPPPLDVAPSPEDLFLVTETHESVRDAVGTLDDRLRTIIERRYLNGHKASLREVGEGFGISRERARQLETQAFWKISQLVEAPS